MSPSRARHMSVKFLRGFSTDRRGAALLEFAINGIALFAFFMAIINVGLLGMSFGALERGVEGTARMAAANAAANYVSSNYTALTCPTAATVQGYFKAFAVPALSDNATVKASWTNNGTGTNTTDPAAVYVTVTATYTWRPLGFPYGTLNIPLSLNTIAVVTGSNGVSASCS
jgi:Flp pilus assembly protein TadG